MTSKAIKSLQENRAVRWLTEHVFRFPTMTLVRRVMREPYEVTIDRLYTSKNREDAKTVELKSILEAKTALVESKETNAQLKKDISAVGGKPVKVEPEVVPVPRGRRA
ncbi:MAG: hypothetical protein ACUZ8A_06465 [Candidatus Bathyanammoxibius sp.]